MKLKEFFNSNLRTASAIGTNRFRLSLNKEAVKTPHYVMSRVLDILENRPSLASGLRNICLFIFNDMKFFSTDKKSMEFANKWLELRPDLENELFNFIYLLMGTGTSYLEPVYKTKVTGERVLDMLYYIQDPSLIYINLAAKDDSEYWIMELPLEVRSFKDRKCKYWPIYYINGASFFRKLVWGVAFAKDELWQAKWGWSRSPWYGYGLLSTAIDNDEVMNEIIKNWALIAKYRSLSKKIIGFYNENGEPVDMSEIDRIKEEFDSLEEEDSLLINKKFVAEDLTFNGNDNMMNQELEYIRKDSGSSLVPNYMTAFSQDSSLATAQEAKVPFSLQLKSLQKIVTNYLNKFITEKLKESYPWLSDDLKIVLAKPELYTMLDKFNVINQLYNMRAATFNELRQSAGLEPVDNGETWGTNPLVGDANLNESYNKKKSKSIKLSKTTIESMKPTNIEVSVDFDISKDLKDKMFKEAVEKSLNINIHKENKLKHAVREFLK